MDPFCLRTLEGCCYAVGPGGGIGVPHFRHFTVLSLSSIRIIFIFPQFGHLRLRLKAARRDEYIPHMLIVPALYAG